MNDELKLGAYGIADRTVKIGVKLKSSKAQKLWKEKRNSAAV